MQKNQNYHTQSLGWITIKIYTNITEVVTIEVSNELKDNKQLISKCYIIGCCQLVPSSK